MEGTKRGAGGGGGPVAAVALWLLVGVSLTGAAAGLNADGALLMSFKAAVTADPLGALAGWDYDAAEPCAWNGVVCKGYPQPGAAAANVTSTSSATDGNSTAAAAWNGTAAGGLNASLAAATVSRVISLVLPNARLTGALPPDLGRVEHLQHLDLAGNALNGTLPAALLDATELGVLSPPCRSPRLAALPVPVTRRTSRAASQRCGGRRERGPRAPLVGTEGPDGLRMAAALAT